MMFETDAQTKGCGRQKRWKEFNEDVPLSFDDSALSSRSVMVGLGGFSVDRSKPNGGGLTIRVHNFQYDR